MNITLIGVQFLKITPKLVFSNFGKPRMGKRLRRISLDGGSDGISSINVLPIFKFDRPGLHDYRQISLDEQNAMLGQAVLGQAIFGSQFVTDATIPTYGEGEYIGLTLYSSSATYDPWEIDGVLYNYLDGRRMY